MDDHQKLLLMLYVEYAQKLSALIRSAPSLEILRKTEAHISLEYQRAAAPLLALELLKLEQPTGPAN